MLVVLLLVATVATSASRIPDSLQVVGDPCAFKKCAVTEECVKHEDETKDEVIGVCVARKSDVNQEIEHTVKKRSTTQNGYCGDNECRFGECEVLNGTVYACHCFKGVTGSKCNILDKTQLPCASNPCYGSAVCINLPDKFACVCHGDLAGPQCRHHKKPCLCRNGGSCIEDVSDLFRCNCPLGFGGSQCQFEIKANYSCQLPGLGCLNEGVCTITNKCKCPSNFTGLRCETYVASSTKATSSVISTSTPEPKLINSRNLCILGVCQNGGTCVQVDFTSAMCICGTGFSGPFCTITTTKSPITSSNVSKPKQPYRLAARLIGLNQTSNSTDTSTIVSSTSTTVHVSSTLTTTSTTVTTSVESFCTSNSTKCQNGGKCEKDACVCPSNFAGLTCETPITCEPSPCKNGQPCLVMNGVARCFCAQDFVEPFCDLKQLD